MQPRSNVTAMASLGLVSPEAATDGVTPIVFSQKTDDLFSHRYKVMTFISSQLHNSHLTTFVLCIVLCKFSDDFFSFGCHLLDGVTLGGAVRFSSVTTAECAFNRRPRLNCSRAPSQINCFSKRSMLPDSVYFTTLKSLDIVTTFRFNNNNNNNNNNNTTTRNEAASVYNIWGPAAAVCDHVRRGLSTASYVLL